MHAMVMRTRYGKVEDAVVMYDKKTGRSRGFGFITYDNPDVVRKASHCSCLAHEHLGWDVRITRMG